MELTERFAEVVSGPSFRLGEAALLVAAHADRACDVEANLAILDDLAATVPREDVESLCASVFGQHGFHGARDDYYDPRNSYLHEVLARRCGIPITLSVVLIEVGRRAGIPLVGVSTPAHFVVATQEQQRRYVDAFGGGRLMDLGALHELFARIAPGVDISPYLGAVAEVDILRRILANLIAIQRRTNDRDGLLWGSRLRTLLPGATPDDHRTYAGALAGNGAFVQAAKVFEELVAQGRSADPDSELAKATRLRSRLN